MVLVLDGNWFAEVIEKLGWEWYWTENWPCIKGNNAIPPCAILEIIRKEDLLQVYKRAPSHEFFDKPKDVPALAGTPEGDEEGPVPGAKIEQMTFDTTELGQEGATIGWRKPTKR